MIALHGGHLAISPLIANRLSGVSKTSIVPMGVIYSLCCANHREQLDIGKVSPGGESRPVTPNLVDKLRRDYQNWEETPTGKAQLERLLALIAEFIQRHRGCYLVVGIDRGYEWEKRAGSSGHSWVDFSIFEDGPYWELEFGKRKPIVDRVLRDEIRDQKLRRFQAQGQEDKVKLLDENGELDVLQYMKLKPLGVPITEEKAVRLCLACGGHGVCGKCGGGGKTLGEERFEKCSVCSGTGACRRCNGTGLVERTEQ